MGGYSFEAVLVKPEGVGTWTFLGIPIEVSAMFGSKGQVKVKGTINGYPFRSTALPMGDGSHYLVVGKDIRDHIAVAQGDLVKVVLELDSEVRRITVPDDFLRAMDGQPQARQIFDRLSYSHQKEYVNWILSAKQTETRQRRVDKAIVMLSQGKNLRE